MRESISNTFIFNIIIIFIGILIVLLVGSLSYSKAYKVKNRIIEIIEKHENYNVTARNEIDQTLANIGYRINTKGIQKCPDQEGGTKINVSSNYHYCIYEFDSDRGRYYRVIVYMYFDIPIIGSQLEFPVSGETKIIYEI